MKTWRSTARRATACALASALALALAFALSACKDDPRRLEQIFLADINGEWTGEVTETSTTERRRIRDTQMRLVVHPEDRPLVEFPLLDCAGTLLSASEELPDRITQDSGRFYQHVPKARGGPCRPGPVRLRLDGETLEYVHLGNSLMRVVATLERTPGTENVE